MGRIFLSIPAAFRPMPDGNGKTTPFYQGHPRPAIVDTKTGGRRYNDKSQADIPKLTNYIRVWQADGESEKTSIRTKTALGQLVEDGGFKGGMAPYGYDLVKSGRVRYPFKQK